MDDFIRSVNNVPNINKGKNRRNYMDDFIRSVNNVSNINKGKTDGTIWMTSLGV